MRRSYPATSVFPRRPATGGPHSSTTSSRRARRATCSSPPKCCSAIMPPRRRGRSGDDSHGAVTAPARAGRERPGRRKEQRDRSQAHEAACAGQGPRGAHPRRVSCRAQRRDQPRHRGDTPAEGPASPPLRRGAHRGAGRVDPQQGRAPAAHRQARVRRLRAGGRRAPLARGAEGRPARGAGDGARGHRERGLRDRAHREHPARGPEPRRGGRGLQAPHRGARPHPGRAGRAGGQGPLHRGQRPAALAAPRGNQAGHRRRSALDGPRPRAARRLRRRRPQEGGREGHRRRAVGPRRRGAGAAVEKEAPPQGKARGRDLGPGAPPGGKTSAAARRQGAAPRRRGQRHDGDPLRQPARAGPHPRRHPGRVVMTEHTELPQAPAPLRASYVAPEAKPHRELTVRAVCVAVVVAALMGAAEPVVVLRIGYGPNMSVVSAFLGFIAISLLGLVTGVRGTRWENNLVEAARPAAGSGRGFMAVVLAAIDMLNARGLLNLHLSGPPIFPWLGPSWLLGVLLAVPLRKHYIDQENLTFADGTAAGETLLVLDEGPRQAGPRVAALGIGGGISGLFTLARQTLGWIPETIAFTFITPHAAALRIGVEVGVLSLGAGLLVGMRITLSMGLGMVLAWIVAPEPLFRAGLV